MHPGGVPVVLICRQVTEGTWNSHRSLKEDLVVLPPKMYMVSSTAHAQWPLRCAGDLDALCCGTQHIVERSNQWRSLKQRPGALPGWSAVVKSAALEAARSGGPCEHSRQWLGAQWAGLFLGVPSCPESPGAP